ncbi:uncharacterized protein LOC100210911 [Hydra vulgaris]|uniref:uncharacterized protein LOC100210911 n=1 Tax=Hydra vulgaris TaxID=6087 RepID=UPI00064170A0|nr:unnamed protein product [Hydra vulgaris]XP_047131197.1 uncharacterized protein LOC100210911 [Hydra vulgaris]
MQTKNFFFTIMLYCFNAIQLSESSAQLKIHLETFKVSYPKILMLIKEREFEICFGAELLDCFISKIFIFDKTNTIHFPKTLSGVVNNPLLLKLPSSKVNVSLSIKPNLFWHEEVSTNFCFNSVGMKNFTATNILTSTLSFTVSLNCDDNFKPPDCVKKICDEHDDDINGHYTCSKNGTIICRDGWIDPLTMCRTVSMLPQISRVGCYNDFGIIAGMRLFTTLVNYRSFVNWNNRSGSFKNITELCSSFVKDNSFEYFGISYWGECWTGSTLDINYDRDGGSFGCWPSQNANLGPMLVGKEATIMVYKWNYESTK